MQKPFSDLSQRGQVRRLTELAQSALKAYALEDTRLALLAHLWNTTFRVLTPHGDRYLLRIHHPDQASVEVVCSELLWLSALRQEANLPVPQPVRNKEQHLVTVVTTSDVAQPRLCVLFRWVDGRFFDRGLTSAHLFQVGDLMARLHDHTAHWERPAGFSRKRVDSLNPALHRRDDGFDEAVAAEAIRTVSEVSTSEMGVVVAEAIRRVWCVVRTLGQAPEVFGLIHGDLHQWNYLFHRGAAGAIDFDDCGYGHWLYDLAVTLTELDGHHPHYPALRQSLLAGYRRRRALSVEHENYLNTFMALRRLQNVLGIFEERNHPAFRDTWQARVAGELRRLQVFVSE